MAQGSYKRVLAYSPENSSRVREAASAGAILGRETVMGIFPGWLCTCHREEEAGQERDSLERCFCPPPPPLVCQSGGLGEIMELVKLTKLIVFSLPSAETTEGV